MMEDKNFVSEQEKDFVSASARRDFAAAKEDMKTQKQLEKEHLRAERYKERAAARREKARRRAEIKEQREYVRKERKRLNKERQQQNGHKSGKNGGLIAAVISLGITTVILSAVLISSTFMPQKNTDVIETAYRKSFYDTVVQVDNMDLNLSKTLATRDSGAMQTYLVDLAVNSELAENNLQQLPIQDENKFYTTKIVNQVGDYAKYLNKKLIRGEKPSTADYENLKNLYKANLALKNALQAAMKDMGEDFEFADIGRKFEGNSVLKNLDELQELSVEYPELIYDGPFSDGRDSLEIKGLDGRRITEAEAKDIFNSTFSEYSPKNVEFTGKSTGRIPAYGVQGEINGDIIYAQITETGGKMIMFSYSGSCGAVNYGETAATEKALAFIGKTGIENMKVVWINLSNNVYTINFAPELKGAIIYPDLVKVRVCAETGMVIGFEATGYYTNHTERTVGVPALSKAEARAKVSDDIEVNTARLAIVPTGESSERLCYEFSGEMDGDVYYVYIDAISGRQVEMFKVINSEEGMLLM